MIVGIGIDAARIGRVREMLERFGDRFTARVFTAEEREYCDRRRDRSASYAARFAAKEAVMKALGAGWGQGVRWREIEVGKGERGAPVIRLGGGAQTRAEQLAVKKIHVSLTHEGDMSIAAVAAED